jgi:hypothetical protein
MVLLSIETTTERFPAQRFILGKMSNPSLFASPANIWKQDTLLNLSNVVVDSYKNMLDAVMIKLQLINDGINYPNSQTSPTEIQNQMLPKSMPQPNSNFYCSPWASFSKM